jgi:hypothetical protein
VADDDTVAILSHPPKINRNLGAAKKESPDKTNRLRPVPSLSICPPKYSPHVIQFDTEAGAIAISDGTEFGLATSICTRDITRAYRVAHQVQSASSGSMAYLNETWIDHQ